ncbi:leucine-rich repeat-containing protein 34 [Drosophila innubila]|uniref:leucine-rich repeat-containing protein 34 n=1 Tax=Drosophila innubila TaxID=198719 RepID=UPI00148C7398|nr:leucine-rich repeat-containing protein 34 [Drosophila innubila]
MCEQLCGNDLSCSLNLPPIKGRPFPVLLLSCWQREYDVRPYNKFKFSRLDFEERMNRNFRCISDLHTIVKFMLQRRLLSVSISGVVVSNRDAGLLQSFVRSLSSVSKIELKLMRLPYEFFVMLRLNVHKMKLCELSLKGTPLSDRDANMLREFLLASKTLHTLNVSSCSLCQYNFATVADGVHKSSSIRKLCANRLVGLNLSLDTDKIASIVGSLLMQNKLVELTMNQCEFVAQDMEIIAEYLQNKNSSLKRLELAYNKISADGAMFLMRAISQGGVLELLDISGNTIGTHGGEWIAKYFSSCQMLQHLYINNNDIAASAINLILLTLKKPCRIKRLQVYNNHFDKCSAQILHRLLEAKILNNDEIDISCTYDQDSKQYRIVPWL